jgi:protoheme IX farnesyltransferase
VKLFRRLAVAATVSVFLLVGVGGLVRATGSGLGCPGWPRCYGHLFPPFGRHGTALYHAIIESSHRYVTFLLSVLVVALVVLAIGSPQVRRRAGATLGASAAAILLVLQAALGAVVVNSELNPVIVTLHYANAMLLVAAIVFTAIASYLDLRVYRPSGPHRGFARHVLGTTIATFVLILIGTYVRGRGAGLVFADWPLMNGRLIPSFTIPLATIQFAHRLAALLVAVGVVGMVVLAARRERDRPPVQMLASVAAALFATQVMLGAGFIWSVMATFFVVGHELTGSLVWGAMVALTILAYRLAPRGQPESLRRALSARRRAAQHGAAGDGDEPIRVPEASDGGAAPAEGGVSVDTRAPAERGVSVVTRAPAEGGVSVDTRAPAPSAATDLGAHVRAYLALTKPRIILLLLITTVPAMVLAEQGWPSPWLILATLIGGSLAAAGANAINCYIDRDIDQVMRRTRARPLPRHEVSPTGALRFGVALGALSFAWLATTVNLLSAALAISALLFYVFVYTLWMKRSTPQNIVIGGAAGAVPVLVGWSAVTDRIGLPAIVLFLIVFYWTPPHFWALSMRYESDYRAAGVPMLPVVRGVSETTRQILLYSFVLFAVTLLLYPVARLGPLYLSAALVLGGIFLFEAFVLRREGTVGRALHLFHYSNAYLALLFAAVAADPLVRAIH